MYLEHINLVVYDINQSLKFYQVAFPHWTIRTRGQANWHGVDRNWLHFGDDYHYLTFNDCGQGVNRDLSSNAIGLAHFAYAIKNLDDLEKRMTEAGYNVAKRGPDNPFRRNVYYIDPDGFEIEFVEYYSDLPLERNNTN